MSSYRRGGHNEIYEQYDEFKRFIDREFRDDPDYPDLALCTFDDMPEPGMDHLILYLENVTSGDTTMLSRVERFCPGTKASFDVGVVSKAVKCTVTVPINRPRESSRGSSAPAGVPTRSATPNPFTLLKWNAAVVGLLVVAWKTTEWRDWAKLGGTVSSFF